MNHDTQVKRRILLVDDEPSIVAEMEKILRCESGKGQELNELESRLFGGDSLSDRMQMNFDITVCRQGLDAVEQVRLSLEQQNPFAVAFIDVRMPPGIDGVAAAERIRQLDKEVEIVMVTGYSDFDLTQINRLVQPEDKLLYMQKPVHAQEVRQTAISLSSKWLASRQLRIQTEQLRQANERLMEHDRLKSEFVLTVSHELRTPLTVFKNILSNALAGVGGVLPPKVKANLQMADEAVSRLAGLISDFLDISKLDIGKMKIHPELMTIHTLVDKVTGIMRLLTESKGIDFQVYQPPHPVMVSVDFEKMAQVLTNLLDNAVKFVPECGGKISVEVSDRVDSVRISIRDNGPGIPPEDRQRIFDRFEQVEKNHKVGQSGTGLGLAICKELVYLHGGRISVENNPDGGAHFMVSLPKQQLNTEEQLCEAGICSIKEE